MTSSKRKNLNRSQRQRKKIEKLESIISGLKCKIEAKEEEIKELGKINDDLHDSFNSMAFKQRLKFLFKGKL